MDKAGEATQPSAAAGCRVAARPGAKTSLCVKRPERGHTDRPKRCGSGPRPASGTGAPENRCGASSSIVASDPSTQPGRSVSQTAAPAVPGPIDSMTGNPRHRFPQRKSDRNLSKRTGVQSSNGSHSSSTSGRASSSASVAAASGLRIAVISAVGNAASCRLHQRMRLRRLHVGAFLRMVLFVKRGRVAAVLHRDRPAIAGEALQRRAEPLCEIRGGAPSAGVTRNAAGLVAGEADQVFFHLDQQGACRGWPGSAATMVSKLG